MRIRALVLAGALIVSGGMQMRAQMSGAPPSPPIGTKEDPARAVDGLLSMMEFQVIGAAKACQPISIVLRRRKAFLLRARRRSLIPCAPLRHR